MITTPPYKEQLVLLGAPFKSRIKMIEIVEGGPTTLQLDYHVLSKVWFQSCLLSMFHVVKRFMNAAFFAKGPDQNAQQAQESPFLHSAHLESWILMLDLVIDGFCLNRFD